MSQESAIISRITTLTQHMENKLKIIEDLINKAADLVLS